MGSAKGYVVCEPRRAHRDDDHSIINWRMERDFVREWTESLRVKHNVSLGEDKPIRLERERK